MPRCVKCGRDVRQIKNGFCSVACSNLDLQERINDACKRDDSHTQDMVK
ncbi:MAG: hypothetical protein ACE5GR_06090 [Nitrosopumilus sp.]